MSKWIRCLVRQGGLIKAPRCGTMSVRAGKVDVSVLVASKPAGLGLQRGVWRVPVQLIHWKMFVQSLYQCSSI